MRNQESSRIKASHTCIHFKLSGKKIWFRQIRSLLNPAQVCFNLLILHPYHFGEWQGMGCVGVCVCVWGGGGVGWGGSICVLSLLFIFWATQWNYSVISCQADLAANETTLMQKITLLCLMEVAFNRKSTDRSFTFEHIATETKLPENEVRVPPLSNLAF